MYCTHYIWTKIGTENYFYRPQMKLQDGNVFTSIHVSVILSGRRGGVGGGVGGGWERGGDIEGRLSRMHHSTGGLHPGGGVCIWWSVLNPGEGEGVCIQEESSVLRALCRPL